LADVEKTSHSWSSRPAFLLAAIGGAVGLGNLWRFPYVAGEYGGGAFVLMYLAFVFLLGVPLMAGEMLLGRRGHRSPVNSIAALVREEDAKPFWRAIGWISLAVPFIGLSYYAVVAAWAIDYFSLASINAFAGFDGDTSGQTFNLRADDPVYQASLHALFVAMTAWVVANGVNKGIERASRILMPTLFIVMIVLVIYGMVAGDFVAAADFLFNPDFSALSPEAFLVALGQALFSLGIGVGLMITYSSYMPREYSLRSSVTIICIGDTLAALLAGFAIFPIVFASSLDPAEGPGLIFVTLPIAFGNMAGGQVIGTLFFILLLFAAFTSAIGMLEPVVAWLEEKYPGQRKKMAVIAASAVWVLGLGSVLSFSFMSGWQPLAFLGVGKNFFGIADFTVANVLAPVNALLIALFAGWVIRSSVVDEEFSGDTSRWKTYWRFANRYLTPVALLIVLIDLLTS
jgi:NSS family neurotransmitter:Na+ symporter